MSKEIPASCFKPLSVTPVLAKTRSSNDLRLVRFGQPSVSDASFVQIEGRQARQPPEVFQAGIGDSGLRRDKRCNEAKPATGASPASVIGDFVSTSNFRPVRCPIVRKSSTRLRLQLQFSQARYSAQRGQPRRNVHLGPKQAPSASYRPYL